jgi:hypothetical protein
VGGEERQAACACGRRADQRRPEDRRSAGRGRRWRMTCGRRARAGGARAGGSMRVRRRHARAGDGAEEEGMTCGRCARGT